MAQINAIQPVDDSGVTSLSIWNNCIIASYANGMIRFFDPENGENEILIFLKKTRFCYINSSNLWFYFCTCKMY
jgi:hypothetical protein